MMRCCAIGVGLHYLAGNFAYMLEELGISGNVGYAQIEGYATLLGSFQIARATKFEVGFSNLETVIRLHHDVNTLAGVLRELVPSDQNAIGLVGSASHPATQLMKL